MISRKKYDEVTLKELIEEQKRSGKLSEEMCTSIREKDILRFLNTPVGERMHRAAVRGTLWAEQPFVLGIDADELYKGESLEETVLVQGIIDVWFEEDGELVVLDYKTDRVFKEEILREKYHTQLDYYARALEQLTGKCVKEKIIYSFTCKKKSRCEYEIYNVVFTGDQYRDIFLIWNKTNRRRAKKKVADTGGDASFNGGFGRLCWSLCRDANIPT